MAARRLLIAIVLLWAAGPAVDAQRPSTVTISVIATTDLHGNVLPRGERGGIAQLAGYVAAVRDARARDGGGVLLVDSGDLFEGALESDLNEGEAVVRAYNLLGYAAAAIGNHEFGYGPLGPQGIPRSPKDDPRGALKARARQAKFPFLAANIIDNATRRQVAWPNIKPSTMITVDGVKIGIVGVTTIETPRQTPFANVKDLTFEPIGPAMTREAMALRARGAKLVIVLAHAGGRCTQLDNPADTSSCDPMAEIMTAARQVPAGAVDMISAGHTHQAMAHDVAGIPVVEAYANGRAFSRVDFVINRATRAVVRRQIFPPRDVVPGAYEDRPVRTDATVAAAIAPAVEQANEIKNALLGVTLDTPFSREPREAENALGDLLVDGMLASTRGADVAITNGGGFRADLPAGPLRYGALYEAFPFNNRLVTGTLTGDQLTRIVAYNLQRTAVPTELIAIAGVRIHAACEAMMLRVSLTRPSGAPIRGDEKLTLVTSDFVADGGDGVLAPAGVLGPFVSVEGAPIQREAVADWLRKRGGHLAADQYIGPDHRRWTYPGSRPVMCR